ARQRISLVIEVCAAVEAAHRQLIVHRDIKPANILVGADGQVKLLDFGIARILEGDEVPADAVPVVAVASQTTTQTQGRAWLTPRYASPEQRAGQPTTTASDVYQLGLLLWTLIAERAPGDVADQTHQPALPAPSTCATRPLALPAADLDAVVAKALATDPAARYASADRLREDLTRLLDGYPVAARPASRGYRLRRFAARHRGGVAAGLLVAGAILAGIVGTLWQAQLAREAAEVAQQEAERAASAAAEARTQAARAEAQLRRADALREFLMQLFDASDRDRVVASIPTVAELLERGAARARDASALDPVVQADMLATIGRLYTLAGRGDQAAPLLDLAIDKARERGTDAAFERARALMWRALAGVGSGAQTADDESGLEEAEALLAEVAPSHPLRAELRWAWSWLRHTRLDFEGALALIAPVLDGSWGGPAPSADARLRLMTSAALFEQLLGRLDAAKRRHDAVIAAFRERGEHGTRAFAVALVNASDTDLRIGALDDAEARTREALTIYDQLGDAPSQYRASAWLRLGQVLEARGRFDEALEALDQSNREWAALRGLDVEAYAFTWYARGLLAAAALDTRGAAAALERFIELATEAGFDIRGTRALVEAELAGARCALGDLAASTGIATARTALQQGAYDRIRTTFAIEFAEARCALALGDAAAAIAALNQAALAAPPARGTESRDTRATLLRIEALQRLGDSETAHRLAVQAAQRLDVAGLGEHPYRALLETLRVSDGAR
ncbi:MAG TPA: protein kinase, partial [Xanthomonadaceae bacterium]|nr:protein kinase [Xanthomonadaceae bacterium]